MLGLVVVHNQTGVDYTGDPAEKGQKQTQNETEQATRHQDGDRRENDAEKIAKRFHGQGNSQEGCIVSVEKPLAQSGGARVRPENYTHPTGAWNPFPLQMKTNLIALMFLGLVAIFLAGCAASTETTTTTTRTREQSSMYAR